MPSKPTWLITGGAGYIGAHVARTLLAAGYPLVALDDLSTGEAARVPDGIPLYTDSVLNTRTLNRILRRHHVHGVIHLAGRKSVLESMSHPLDYYRNNVQGMHSLLTAMIHSDARAVLFSSTAAVYGTPDTETVTEATPTNPESPYGRTKLVCEYLLRDAAAAHHFNWATLRYFNIAGAASPELADRGADNLIPRILRALDAGIPATVFGTQHPTPDGTCIRDYLHVDDLAAAHATVVAHLSSRRLNTTYNVGRGHGVSVLQVINAISQATGQPLAWIPAPPRTGDPPRVVANSDKITTELGWRARHDLNAIIRSTCHTSPDASTSPSVNAVSPVPMISDNRLRP